MVDELLYAAFLIGHIAFGAFYLDKVDHSQKRIVCTAIGLATSLILTRYDLIHQLIMASAALVLIAVYRRVPVFNLYWALNGLAFGYLLFFRFICTNNFSNMIMMMLTLRVGGLGAELDATSKDAALKEAPLLDVFHYSFSYMGFLAGPYIRFRTFVDYMNGVCVTTFDERKRFLEDKLSYLPIFVGMLVFALIVAPVDSAKTSDFHNEAGFLYTVWYMIVMFIGFRARLYGGFMLAECVCIAGGMGAYPREWKNQSGQGPSVQKGKARNPHQIDFFTVQNLDFWACETSNTVKETMRCWNQTVQYWLAVNCYKKLPFSRSVRMGATLAVSAFWHGIRPGYYLCLITMVFFATAEEHLITFFTKRPLISPPRSTVGKMIFAQLKLLVFAYLGVAFIMLTLPEILQYYWNLYFFGHIIVAIILVVFGSKAGRSRLKKS